jgi:hypothetical protein
MEIPPRITPINSGTWEPTVPAVEYGERQWQQGAQGLDGDQAYRLLRKHLLHASSAHPVKVFRNTDLTTKETLFALPTGRPVQSAEVPGLTTCQPWQ